MFGKLRDSWVVWRRKVNEKFGTFNPEPKTEEMTVPVGVDSEGRLWTSGEGGGGGGGTTCYKIRCTYAGGYDSGQFKLNVIAPFTMDVIDTQGIATVVDKNGSITINVEWDEDLAVDWLYNGYPLANSFIYAKEYTTTEYHGNSEQDPISKFITVEEVTL